MRIAKMRVEEQGNYVPDSTVSHIGDEICNNFDSINTNDDYVVSDIEYLTPSAKKKVCLTQLTDCNEI